MGTRQLITVLEHIVAQRFDEKLIREKNGHLARDVLDTWHNLGDGCDIAVGCMVQFLLPWAGLPIKKSVLQIERRDRQNLLG